MQSWMYSVGRPSNPGVLNINEPEEVFHASAFPWSSCFAGSWLVNSCWISDGHTVSNGFPFFGAYVPWSAVNESCRGHLVYVVGHRHRHPPFCTAHTPQGHGFVPQHPLDRRGQPSINGKNGVFVLAFEKNNVQARFESGSAKDLRWNPEMPRSFAAAPKDFMVTSGKAAVPPTIEGRVIHAANSSPEAAKTVAISEGDVARYDYKTRNFVAPHSVVSGISHNNVDAKSDGDRVVAAPVGSRGASGGVTGHGSGSWSGSHSSGGEYSSGGSSGGGGSHASGTSSGNSGSGGVHSGGGSSASSSGGNSSSGGGGSSAPSGHH
jgi:uncharacterized membrane protein YgcG